MKLTHYTQDNPPEWANDPIETDETQRDRLARRARDHQVAKARNKRRRSRAARKRNRS